jgi:hypothetical protein
MRSFAGINARGRGGFAAGHHLRYRGDCTELQDAKGHQRPRRARQKADRQR